MKQKFTTTKVEESRLEMESDGSKSTKAADAGRCVEGRTREDDGQRRGVASSGVDRGSKTLVSEEGMGTD